MLLTRNEEESSQRYETRERFLYKALVPFYKRGSTEVEEEEISDTSRFKRKPQGVFEWTKLNICFCFGVQQYRYLRFELSLITSSSTLNVIVIV